MNMKVASIVLEVRSLELVMSELIQGELFQGPLPFSVHRWC